MTSPLTDTIDISGLDKAEVLRRLYNAAQPQGLGHLHYTSQEMTTEEARELLKERQYFDYLKGRVMKIDMKREPLWVGLYDRDNGHGAARRALGDILSTANAAQEA